MSPETIAYGVTVLVFIAGATGFYLGVKADMWAVAKCARLGVPYVIGEKVYKVALHSSGHEQNCDVCKTLESE